MTSQLFNLCELRQIHATDFASKVSLTVGIVFVRVTCKLFEFIIYNFTRNAFYLGTCQSGSDKWKALSVSPSLSSSLSLLTSIISDSWSAVDQSSFTSSLRTRMMQAVFKKMPPLYVDLIDC